MEIRSESEVKGQRPPRISAKRLRAFGTRNISDLVLLVHKQETEEETILSLCYALAKRKRVLEQDLKLGNEMELKGNVVLFARLAASGSKSATTDCMDISRSDLEKRIAQLEKQLDTELIEKGQDKVVLTEAGQKLYESIIDEVEKRANINLKIV